MSEINRIVSDDGLLFEVGSSEESEESRVESSGLLAMLQQLVDDGFASQLPQATMIPWESMYRLIADEAYSASINLLNLPAIQNWRPILRERGSLADPDFSVTINGWIGLDGDEHRGRVVTSGAFITTISTAMLPRDAWATLTEVKSFARRTADEVGLRANQLGWARIRKAARSAGAVLSDYLRRTTVVTPDHLTIELRRNKDLGVIEVLPGFEDQPQKWLESFDRLSLRPRYDIPVGDDIVHVMFTEDALSVLKEVKAMPARRVAGDRARAFVSNPYNFLGSDAADIIDANQIEAALTAAEIGSTRFYANHRASSGEPISITIEETIGKNVGSTVLEFRSPGHLSNFIDKGKDGLVAGYRFFFWEGYEFDLFGDAEDQLEYLALALEQWNLLPIISLAEVLDLSRYTDRGQGFGVDKPFYSPFLARKTNEEGWLPDNVTIGLQFQGEHGPVAVSLDGDNLDLFEQSFNNAKNEGLKSFSFSGCPQPIPVEQAENMLAHIHAAKKDVANQTLDPKNVEKAPRRDRQTLLIKPNVDTEDYVAIRGEIGYFDSQNVEVPSSLLDGVKLKSHQTEGLAWLEHLWRLSPGSCRGALLADDMGLGKTLQILSFISWCLEQDPDIEPILIVAPVTLLDNWIDEIKRFFRPGTLPLLRLHGDEIAARLVPQNAIDAELRTYGFTKLLRPDWVGKAKLVLTNYETLRELELSLARQSWSIMVCDEAQAIKNPNALVTKAAKKQKSRFTIACTGTPVENSLVDLWCLFDLIQPGLLGPLNRFGSSYRRPIETSTETQLVKLEELRRLIRPQTLRRMKIDVAKDLPAKHDDVACKQLLMSDRQKQQFAHLVKHLKSRRAASSPPRARMGMDTLFTLKQFFAHPTAIGQSVLTFEQPSIVAEGSPKVKWLLQKLEEIRSRGEKALVFCELKDLQRMLQHVIRSHFGIQVDIVNGDSSTNRSDASSRLRRIDNFQQRAGFGCIVLSPLVAGFGLNIQAANHVIHFTRLWNPAKEDQATDRAYRIGQTKDVHVYCPVITAPDFTTFDVKLDRLLSRKRELSYDMLNGNSAVSESDFMDLEDVDGAAIIPDRAISESDLISMNPQAFEAFCSALWAQQGYTTSLTPVTNDGGIDVVAVNGEHGLLIQCKTSRSPDSALGWEAVKDVAAGATAYATQYGNVLFKKVAVTNQRFNDRAREQASHNGVELVDRKRILELLRNYPVLQSQVERLL